MSVPCAYCLDLKRTCEPGCVFRFAFPPGNKGHEDYVKVRTHMNLDTVGDTLLQFIDPASKENLDTYLESILYDCNCRITNEVGGALEIYQRDMNLAKESTDKARKAYVVVRQECIQAEKNVSDMKIYLDKLDTLLKGKGK
ncbi:LOB domain-containing protein 25 [Tanacetum coccineum]